MKKKLSILIPIYNKDEYIGECLDGLLKQVDFELIEVILYNDGSNDNSVNIVNNYLKNYKQIEFVNNCINKGAAEARNYLINRSNGEYIWFFDADDLMSDFILEKILNSIENSIPDLVIGGFDVIDFNGLFNYGIYYTKEYFECDNKVALNLICEKSNWALTNKIIKKELFTKNKISFSSGKKYEDLYVTPYLIMASNIVLFIPEIIYKYRYNIESSLMNKYSFDRVEDHFIGYKYFFEYYCNQFNGKNYNIKKNILKTAITVLEFELEFTKKNNNHADNIQIKKLFKKIFPIYNINILVIFLKSRLIFKYFKHLK